MAHNFQILGHTTAGKRLQNEQRKRLAENLQRDQVALEILKQAGKLVDESGKPEKKDKEKKS